MNSCCMKSWLAVFLALAMTPAAAIEVAWYQQRAPGNASGELRLENLAVGDLEIETPGRRMEHGILRIGDVAIVNLAEPAGRPPRQAHAGELVVVVRQGGANTRAIFQLAMPEPDSVPPSHTSAAPAVPVSAGAANPVNVPDSPPSPDRASASSAADNQAAPRPAEGSAPFPKANPPRNQPAPEIKEQPDVPADLSGDGTVQVASLSSNPAAPLVCPVIAIRPGSLKTNIERLLGDCGARMGDWITGGEDGKTLKDWIVRDPRILAGENREGLAGLLDILYAEYRLQGLPSADAAAIDIYRTDR